MIAFLNIYPQNNYYKSECGLFLRYPSNLEYTRYSKSNLNSQQCKTAYIDNTVISNRHSIKSDNFDEIFDFMKEANIVPVFSWQSVAEMSKAEESGRENFIRLCDLKPLWIIDIPRVIATELINLLTDVSPNQFEVFCNIPVFPFENNFVIVPWSLGDVGLRKKLLPYQECLYCNDPFVRYFDLNLSGQFENEIKKMCVMPFANKTIDLIINTISNHLSSEQNSQKIINTYNNLSRFEKDKKCPLISCNEFVMNKYINEQKSNPKNSHTLKDRMHFTYALSYCDYFFTRDQKLIKLFQEFNKVKGDSKTSFSCKINPHIPQ